MKHGDTTFLQLLGNYTVWRLVRSPDLWAAVIVTVGLCLWSQRVPGVAETAADIGPVLVGVAGGLFSIVLAALAIVAAFGQSPLVVELQRVGRWQNVLFLFFWDSALAIASIVCSVVLALTPENEVTASSLSVLVFVALFLFFYAIFAALQLVGVVLRLALYHAQYQVNKSAEKEGRGCD